VKLGSSARIELGGGSQCDTAPSYQQGRKKERKKERKEDCKTDLLIYFGIFTHHLMGFPTVHFVKRFINPTFAEENVS
jgi:hypothetical protein